MSDNYTKLFSSITESTIWSEPAGTRLVWITFLAKCNKHGEVYGSVPGMARLSNVTLEECEAAIATLLAPDKWSRTPDNEGRRVEAIDGGWRILNHSKFDAIRGREERAAYKREWDRKNRGDRPSFKDRTPPTTPDNPRQNPTDPTPPVTSQQSAVNQSLSTSLRSVDVGIEDSAPDESGCFEHDKPKKPPRNPVPYAQIVNLYHETLPMLPKVEKLTDARKGYLSARWHQDLTTLDEWRNFFNFVGRSTFLTGRAEVNGNKRPFRADLEWITRPGNFAKIAEEKYHG